MMISACVEKSKSLRMKIFENGPEKVREDLKRY